MKRTRLAVALGLCGLLAIAPAAAYDRVVHYDVVYAVAVANGFSAADASLIARASQGLDDNTEVTAFEWGLIGREAIEVATSEVSPSELDHQKSGQVFHALTKHRDVVEKAQIERIRGATDRQRQLVYLGQYLHFVADEVVHPHDPLAGHGPKGHRPDRADLDRDKLRITIGLFNQKLSGFQNEGSGSLTVTTPKQLVRTPERLNDAPRTNLMLEQVVAKVEDSWTRTYALEGVMHLIPEGPEKTIGGKIYKFVADEYLDMWEKTRQARATSEIAQVLKHHDPPLEYTFYKPYEPYVPPTEQQMPETSEKQTASGYPPPPPPVPRDKIFVDRNGEPIGGPGSDGDFSPPAPSTEPGFADRLAANEILQREREDSVAVTAARAAGIAALDAASPWKIPLASSQDDNQRMAVAWVPPSSPGGVALNPRLQLPLDGLGKVRGIELADRQLVLRTDTGSYPFAGVSPRSFATLARAVADGETPFLSIGSEASNRPGYARVTVSPSLRNTREGLALYLADVQFKTIFARLPLAPDLRDTGLENLAAAFPGNGGDYVRFWITSGDIRLALRDGELATVASGMRINSETRLNSDIRSDPEMEQYVDRLTANWDQMAEALPAFREVQSMALATAIVFWARDHHVPIDPLIFTLPSHDAMTPDYAPVVAAYDQGLLVAGGVTLTPEDRGNELGRQFLMPIRMHLSQLQSRDVAWARALLAAEGAFKLLLVTLIPALLLWLLLGRKRSGISLARAAGVWTIAGVAQLLVFALVKPLVMGEALAVFDRNLLALLASFVFFPMLLFSLIARALPTPLPGVARRRGLLVLGLTGPAWVAVAGLGLAEATVALAGPVPTAALHRVLTLEVAPLSIAASGLVSQWAKPDGSTVILPAPSSLFENMRPPFELPHAHEPEGETLLLDDQDSQLPVGALQRVRWPDDWGVPADAHYYTADGRPPM